MGHSVSWTVRFLMFSLRSFWNSNISYCSSQVKYKQNFITSKMEITNMSASNKVNTNISSNRQLHFKLNITPFIIVIVMPNCPRNKASKIPASRGRGQTHAPWFGDQLTHIIHNMMKLLNKQISIHRSKVLPPQTYYHFSFFHNKFHPFPIPYWNI